jgi:hypothetical protein
VTASCKCALDTHRPRVPCLGPRHIRHPEIVEQRPRFCAWQAGKQAATDPPPTSHTPQGMQGERVDCTPTAAHRADAAPPPPPTHASTAATPHVSVQGTAQRQAKATVAHKPNATARCAEFSVAQAPMGRTTAHPAPPGALRHLPLRVHHDSHLRPPHTFIPTRAAGTGHLVRAVHAHMQRGNKVALALLGAVAVLPRGRRGRGRRPRTWAHAGPTHGGRRRWWGRSRRAGGLRGGHRHVGACSTQKTRVHASARMWRWWWWGAAPQTRGRGAALRALRAKRAGSRCSARSSGLPAHSSRFPCHPSRDGDRRKGDGGGGAGSGR